ncbi:MAG TPA: hypothetical protein VF939_20355 [Puia sp.]
MEKVLEELSASALRNLLIDEVKKFIICLDDSSTEELERMKLHLKRVFDLITEKERAEEIPLTWGKNSSQTARGNPSSGSISGMISNLQKTNPQQIKG